MPYDSLPPEAFWKRCREDADFLKFDLYHPKFALETGQKVVTIGSCFAQKIRQYLRPSTLTLLDAEPAPSEMPAKIAARYGYGQFSARYGNVYTPRQLRQLLEDANSGSLHDCAVLEEGGRYYDALRPSCEPEGFSTLRALKLHRLDHLARVRSVFSSADVVIYTLGLTEAWQDRASGLVFPVAPGVRAGRFDEERHVFRNFSYDETREDLLASLELMRQFSPDVRVILTVSPVPLTASASGQHVLRATVRSKSVLRAVADDVCANDPTCDYFPAYEIVTGTPSKIPMFEPNLRDVSRYGVTTVMSVFFAAHQAVWKDHGAPPVDTVGSVTKIVDDETCEEAMLEAFAG